MVLLTIDGFLNHFPMKSLVICQPRGKFDMFAFVYFTYNVVHIIFSGTQKGSNFQRRDENRLKVWYRCKDALINKCLI